MAEVIIKTIFQLRRGTKEAWARNNPLLKAGEPGYETNTGKLKIGDGFTPWLTLPYINDVDVSGQEEIIVVSTYNDLPRMGDVNILYRVIDDKLLYQWNSTTKKYESLGAQGSLDPSIITLINGGNANG